MLSDSAGRIHSAILGNDGLTRCTEKMSNGNYVIRMDVTDRSDETKCAAVSIEVISPQAPTIQILSQSHLWLEHLTQQGHLLGLHG